jgi:hypothetical protein
MTMSSTPIPWTELLSRRFDNVSDEYGPNSQEVASAFWVLSKTKWTEHAGEPISDEGITVVRSWDDALKILDRDLQTRDARYNAMGHLEAPCERLDQIFERMPGRDAWWQAARDEAKRYAVLGGVPQSRPRADRDHVFEYLYEFVSMLLAEIIASPEVECTYFRAQLPWFHAGHFPCGWEGEWPNGRMRIF